MLFIWSLVFGKSGSKLAWLTHFALTATYLALIHQAGAGWAWVGFFWPYVFWVALAVVLLHFIVWEFKKLPAWPRRNAEPWMYFGVTLVVWLMVALRLPDVATARTFDTAAVNLRWPLRDGSFHVVHGGGNAFVNHHFATTGQRYAVDVVQINWLGLRAEGLWPRELDAYLIWNSPVVAPCEGEVVAAQAEHPDLAPPVSDPEHAAGNYVAIHCKRVTVVLAHLQHQSLEVSVGQNVREGQYVGRVGNSGNTSEPHLHMHAVRGRVTQYDDLLWNAEGVPMVLDGRFPVRNDSFVALAHAE